jgi:hypothetical protein
VVSRPTRFSIRRDESNKRGIASPAHANGRCAEQLTINIKNMTSHWSCQPIVIEFDETTSRPGFVNSEARAVMSITIERKTQKPQGRHHPHVAFP